MYLRSSMVAFGAEDESAAVAPRAQAVGREPVHAQVAARAAVADERGFAEILELGFVGIGVVGDRGGEDGGVGRARVEKKLLDLVAADVAEDAAVARPLEEPRGTTGLAEPVRRKTHHLKHAADRAAVNEVAGDDGALHVKPLAIINHVFAAGRGDDKPRRLPAAKLVLALLRVNDRRRHLDSSRREAEFQFLLACGVESDI